MGIGFRFRRQGATGKDIAKIEGDFRRMTEKGIEEVSKDMVNSLRENILAVRGIWRGDLIDSVEAKKLTRNMIAVKMKYYGWMLDKGHNIPPAASGSPYLRAS
jgi:hypothetical protein